MPDHQGVTITLVNKKVRVAGRVEESKRGGKVLKDRSTNGKAFVLPDDWDKLTDAEKILAADLLTTLILNREND